MSDLAGDGRLNGEQVSSNKKPGDVLRQPQAREFRWCCYSFWWSRNALGQKTLKRQ
jgi:hypothetical protein